MSNLHRIQWIDQQIRNHNYPNCSKIAAYFEISVRQATRDIEYLRYSLQAPVQYSARENGYYYSENHFVLPELFISRQDKKLLSYLCDHYLEIGSESSLRIAQIFSRLSGQCIQNEKIEPLEPDPIKVFPLLEEKQLDIYSILKNAINEKKVIAIQYLNQKNLQSQRKIAPYRFMTQKNNFYLVAYCYLKQAARIFNLKRISRAEISREKYFIPDSIDLSRYHDDYIFNYRKSFQAKIYIMPPYQIYELQKIKLDYKSVGPDTYLIDFDQSGRLINQLVQSNLRIKILSPRWLRKKIRQKLQDLIVE